jgi:hypothetical protein
MKLRWPGDASDGEVRLMLAQLDSDFPGEARSARRQNSHGTNTLNVSRTDG